MELRTGYKKTEVGVIPEDWTINRIIECADYVDYRGKTPKKTPLGIVLVTARNIRAGFIDYEVSQEYISELEYDLAMRRGKPCIGDVLITTEAPLGMVASVDREDIALAQRVIKYRGKPAKVYSEYLKFYFLSKKFQAILDENSSGSTAKGIKGSILHQLPVILPTLPEQEAIAEALSDTDALIESLEQLITKKRHLKQGAMQELLTGKKRLPGFSGEWEVKRLGDIAPLQRGFDLPTSTLKQGPFPVVYSNGVLNYHAAFQVKGPGVITGRSGTIGNVTFVEQDFWPHNTSLWVTSFKGNDPKFIFYLYSRIGFERFAIGSGVPTLNRNDVHAFKISIPIDITEQTAIATILSDMDAEITAFETKLAKTRQIKQGMMHNLLTGRIRLNHDS